MREELRNPGRLEHIMLAISRIEEFTNGMTYEQFLEDKMCAHATIYNVVPAVVWDVVTEDIPSIKPLIQLLIEQ